MRFLHRLSVLVLIFGFFSGTADCQTTRELTPDEAVRLGIERNLRLQSARAEVEAAQASVSEVRSGQFPTIRTRADYTRLSGNIPEVDFAFPGLDTTFTILPVELNRYHTEISVEQPIFSGFRLRNQIRAARHEAIASEYEAAQAEADLAFEIRSTYWALYRAIAMQEVMNVSMNQVEAHLQDVENRVEEGTALMSELMAARTRRSEVHLDLLQAENAVRLGRFELSRLIGLPLDTSIDPIASVEVASSSFDWETIAAQAAESRPHIRALDEQVQALRLQVNIARQTWLPDAGLFGRYVYARPNPYFFAEQDQFRGTGEVGVSLRWNLFEGGRRNAQMAGARARLEAAESLLNEARQQVAVEVARQTLEVERTAEAVSVAGQHVEEAEEALRVAQQQFDEGVALSAQVLDAERAYRMAQARRAEAEAAHAIARAALLNALGQVW